ncbi:copper resistance CopC/CopD family protein [Allorhizocola rhizosphaerae]|uniref:copper resistance CopC/CopD family protein n=1 Tax=Allorhizocola rhizosphaerae TaxID=1872709 RepID=UPI000E3B96B1|nr:copper resistance protein CopC [Allorhizocola rhizosphaerae]
MRKLLPLVICALVVLPPAPAHAHAALIASNPAQGTIVQYQPTQIDLTFSEPVTPVVDRIRIIGPDGQRWDRGTPQAEGTELRIPMNENLLYGTYLVSFRVISADSHPVPGGFTFHYVEQSTSPVPAVAPEPEDDPAVSRLIMLAKYVGYAGLVLLGGAAFVLTRLWPARLDRRGPKRLLWLGLGLVAASTIAALALQVPYTGLSWRDVVASPFGIALLIRLATLVVGAILLRPLINGGGGTVARALVLGVAAIGAVTWPLTGHPVGSPVPPVSVVADALHLAGVSLWLGGLAMLALFLLRRANDDELCDILPVWSRWAGITVSAVLLGGVVSAFIEVGTVTALYQTPYGRYLLIKIALVALVIGAAMLARRVVTQGRISIGPMVRVELAIAAVVLGLTATLTQTTPARTAEAIARMPAAEQLPAPEEAFNTTLDSRLFRLRMAVDPGKLGANTIHLYAYTLDDRPLTVLEWKVTAALPSAGVEPITVPIQRIADSHVIGPVTMPTPGDWLLRVTARTTEVDQDTVTVTVPIK